MHIAEIIFLSFVGHLLLSAVTITTTFAVAPTKSGLDSDSRTTFAVVSGLFPVLNFFILMLNLFILLRKYYREHFFYKYDEE